MFAVEAEHTLFRILSLYMEIANMTVQIISYKLNCMALVRKGTIPTELPPLFGEISANICG
jgi:hypothetical protein